MLNKLGSKSKQKLTTLAILGVIAGVGYQVDTAQADTQPGNDNNAEQENTQVAPAANDVQAQEASLKSSQEDNNPVSTEEANTGTQDVIPGENQTSEPPAAPSNDGTPPVHKNGDGFVKGDDNVDPAPETLAVNTPGQVQTETESETPTSGQEPNNPAPAKGPNMNIKRLAKEVAAPTVQTGTWGTSTWTLDNQGVMTIGAGTLGSAAEMDSVKGNVTQVVFGDKVVLPWNCREMFYDWNKVKSYEGLDNVDASKVNLMTSMFAFNFALESIDLSSWNMANVNNMLAMFQGPNNEPEFSLGGEQYMHLTSVKLGNSWGKSSPNLSALFEGDQLLTSADVENWNVSKTSMMANMFRGTGFTSLDLSNWQLRAGVQTIRMFADMPNLTSLNLGTMNFTGLVSGLVEHDTNLTTLDLTNVTSKFVTDALNGTTGLKVLTLGEKTNLVNVGYPGFEYDVALPEITPSADYTGLWQFVGTGTVDQPNGPTYTAAELMATYDGATMAGTYVWQKAEKTPEPDTDTGNTTNPTNPDPTTPDTTSPTTPDTDTNVDDGAVDVVTGGDGATIDGGDADMVSPAKKTTPRAIKQATTRTATKAAPTVALAKTHQQASATKLAEPATRQQSQEATLPQTDEQSTGWLATIAGVLGLSFLGLNWFKRQN
ncbi:BspA family leucine-rich repeat surface protein [Levilactobacillus brevis]|nr:BspA family leucine-rich repeat surface protein [Levilactobacillus brevis]